MLSFLTVFAYTIPVIYALMGYLIFRFFVKKRLAVYDHTLYCIVCTLMGPNSLWILFYLVCFANEKNEK